MLKKIFIICITFIFIFQAFLLISQTTSTQLNESQKKDSSRDNQEKDFIEDYLKILEKTNQQLSLWWNPYGILVAILAILFTLMAIISAIIIFRQSKEHKKIINDSIIKYEIIINKFIKEKKAELENMKEIYSNSINELKSKLKETDKKAKKSIQDAIKKLKIERDSISKRAEKFEDFYVTPQSHKHTVSAFTGTDDKTHTCSFCGFKYIVSYNPFLIGPMMADSYKTIKCPKCGKLELFS